MSLVDLVKADIGAKRQKTPGLRLERGTGHCIVARSSQVQRTCSSLAPSTARFPLHNSGNTL
jgi:hypothetical protein